MTAPNKMAKRAAAGTLALAVCLTGGAIGAGAAHAAAGFKFDQRISGETRFETAIEASKRAFPDGGTKAKAIVLVNGDREVDGLTASYVAGLQDASILYTNAGSYSAATKAEMDRLGTKTVFIVGGTTVVNNSVENDLKTAGFTVTRYGGADRYETAALVARSGNAKPNKVYIASGERLADALVVGPIATAKDYPVLLVEADRVPNSTSSALSALGVNTRVVVGGTSVVSNSTYTSAGATGRLFGADRQSTAIEVAKDAIANEGFKSDSVALIGGNNNNAADALVAAPFAAQKLVPLLFVEGDGLGATKAYLEANASKLTGQGYIFGGTNAVSTAAATAATTAAGGTDLRGNQTIAVAPGSTESRTLVDENTGTQAQKDSDNRVYTASGLQNDKDYRITLVDSRNIAVDNAGVVTFKSSADANSRTGFSADTGANNGILVKVNGSAPVFAADAAAAARTTVAKAVNGTLTFEVDGLAAGDVTPVVYLNGGSGIADNQGGTSARLETNAKAAAEYATPTEPFGIGGKTTFAGAQVSAGAYTVTGQDTVVESLTGSRTYTVEGLTAGQDIRLELVTPTVIDGGKYTLDATKRSATLTAAANATITEINGVTVAGEAIKDFRTGGTSLTFKVTASGATEVVPVVYLNDDDDDKLSVNLAGAAKEPAGIGGKVTFRAAATVPAEAADAEAVAATTVTALYANGVTLNTETGLFTFDDTDRYQLAGNFISKTQFLSILSVGDGIGATTYRATPSSTSFNTYNITTDAAPTPASVVGVASQTTLGQVKVTYASDTEFAPGSTSYELQRRQVSAANTPVAGSAGVFATVDTRTVTVAGTQTFTETLPAGKYEYQVLAKSPSFSGTATVTSAVSSVVDVTTTTTLSAPALQRLFLVSNASNINALSKGDVFKVVLTQPIAAPAIGAKLSIGGADTILFTAASSETLGSATFSVNTGAESVDGVSLAAGTVLTVTLLADPVGGPLTIPNAGLALTTSAGIGNTAGALPDQSAQANNKLTRDVTS